MDENGLGRGGVTFSLATIVLRTSLILAQEWAYDRLQWQGRIEGFVIRLVARLWHLVMGLYYRGVYILCQHDLEPWKSFVEYYISLLEASSRF